MNTARSADHYVRTVASRLRAGLVRMAAALRIGSTIARSCGRSCGLTCALTFGLSIGSPLALTVLAGLTGLTLAPTTVLAADEGALSRIAFVDIPYLIDRAPQALSAEQRLEEEFAPRQAELEQQRAELAALAAKLADSTLEMAEAERALLDRETRGLERRIKRSEQDFREELNIQKNNEFKKVRILVLEAIAAFGKQHDYDLIVSDGVLYANKRIDVTERILESLLQENARLRSSN